MSPDTESDVVLSWLPGTSRSGARRGIPILQWTLAGLILASSFGSPLVAQDTPVPEDSEEQVTLVVRGMTKSRSGAT